MGRDSTRVLFHRSGRGLRLVALAWLLSAQIGLAHAQDTQDGKTSVVSDPAVSEDSASNTSSAGAQPGYGEAVEAGLKEHARGNFEEARVHLLQAHALFPNARTLRGLGKVEYELRNYGEAVRYLEAALTSQVRPLDENLRLETQRLLDRAKVYVGEVHVAVEPGSATVSVDGVTMATGPKASLSLLVGDHVLEFRAQGRLPERRSVRINGGEQMLVQVVLAPPLDGRGEPSAARQDSKPLYRRWWVWTAVGLIAAGAVVGISVAATRDPEQSRTETGSTGVILRNP